MEMKNYNTKEETRMNYFFSGVENRINYFFCSEETRMNYMFIARLDFPSRKEIKGAKYIHNYVGFIVAFLFWCGNCSLLLGQCT